jgi:putative ABC transport system permease protein
MGHVFDWEEGQLAFQRAFIDSQFLNVMDVKLLAGRPFTPQEIEAGRTSRSSLQKGSSVILNETAVEALGWATPEDAVGQVVEPFLEKTVIGVVEDFHFRSLRQPIEPLALEPGGQTMLVARLAPGNVPEALDQLRATWGAFAPDAPFTYHFLDEQIDQLYRSEQRTATIIGGFAGLAVLLACMGLFGLAAYAAERRTKEIGIRKALGASAANIVALLSKDFLLLVAVACAIGAPVAYVAMERWLQDFAYRIDVSPLLFVGATVLAVLIALGSISAQALRAARTDPAEALRYE